ncbi:MAG TPA: biopolymer transporter ExbD [Flavobacteriia bacterium]|nr:biopolymer transporter ExbD [Flavobacteriia bacterium]
MAKRNIPEINAGSMADIAFLLLIFFLVTTTMDIDAGIPRKLPPKQDKTQKPPDIKKRNAFVVNINKNGEILVNGGGVEDKYVTVDQLKDLAKEFLDNGGGKGKNGNTCDYCEGKRLENSSVHPNRAVISIQSSRKTKHGVYVQVTNELVRAYNELREREAQKLYGESYESLKERAKKNPKNEVLKKKLETVKERFPMLLSEAEPAKIE